MKTFEFFIFSLFIGLIGLIIYTKDIYLQGNKNPGKEVRELTGFDQIASSGDFKVMVKHGNRYSVEVKAESNLLPYIKTEVIDHLLIIKTQGFRTLLENSPIEVFITTPDLKALYLSGSGMIKTGRFESDQFRIILSGSGYIDTNISTEMMKAVVSGSGNIFLEGVAKVGRFAICGSGRIKSYETQQRNCEAVILGSGKIFLNTLETIDARITGSGRVMYINHPTVNKSIYGSGEVYNDN